MITRRLAFSSGLLAIAGLSFMLGLIHTQSDAIARASYDAQLTALRHQVESAAPKTDVTPTGTTGALVSIHDETLSSAAARAKIVADVKRDLQREMGLLSVNLFRDRRSSFVELYSYDSRGKTNYGTAGYLGHGYFVTVKHAVIALHDEDDHEPFRTITSVKIVYRGKEIPAKVIDAGDADAEVHSGDWAIIRTRELDLPPLRVDTAFAYEFADPIFRLGNDYSKGIMLSTGNVGQRTPNGLVTCLTDGHPGVSGGGILDQRGDLVGIPIGRMQGDYRFSFILPIRPEMLRKVPVYEPADPPAAVGATQ